MLSVWSKQSIFSSLPPPAERCHSCLPSLQVYMPKTNIWISKTNALFWGAGKLQYSSRDLLGRRQFLGRSPQYLSILWLSLPELSLRETPISCNVFLEDFPSQNTCLEDPKNIWAQKKQNIPFKVTGCILILLEMPRHATVFQCHSLQQLVVHIIANANGEEAEFITYGVLGVAEDSGRLCFPNSGPPIREEDD